MSEIKIPIPARLKNVAKGGHVAGAEDIIDDALNKEQNVINQETLNSLEGLDDRIDTVQQKVDDIGDSIQFDEDGDLVTEDGDDFSDDTARGKIPTIGAIKDGLNNGIYDVSKRNPTGGPNSDGKFTLDYILANADSLIPTSWRHGGMSISFVSSVDNKYVQYRLMSDEWSTTISNWQGIDDEPTAGSNNLVKSGSIYKHLYGETTIVVPTYAQTGHFITLDGTIDTSIPYIITNPIHLLRGQTIKVNARCVTSASLISLTDDNSSFYVNLRAGLGEKGEVSYTVTEDCYVASSYNTEESATIEILSSNGVENEIRYLEEKITQDVLQEKQRAESSYNDLELSDETSVNNQSTQLLISLNKNDGTVGSPEIRNLTNLTLPAATNSKAGLLSAGDKDLLTDALGTKEFIIPTYAQTGHFIKDDGTIDTSIPYVITNPIRLLKGQVIKVNARCVTFGVQIALTDANSSYYTKLKNGLGVKGEVSYEATDDCYVASSYNTEEGIEIVRLSYGSYEHIKNAVDGVATPITPTYAQTGHFIQLDGTVGASIPYVITNPIQLLKGQTIKVDAKCVTFGSLIALTDVNSSFYSNLVAGLGEKGEVLYTATEDCYVALSYNTESSTTIETYSYLGVIDLNKRLFDVETNLKDEISELSTKIDNKVLATNIITAFDHIVSVGDSLTYSQVYTSASASRQAYNPWPKCVKKICGLDSHNIFAISGGTSKSIWNAYKDSFAVPSQGKSLVTIYLGTNNWFEDTIETSAPAADVENYRTAWADDYTGCMCKIIQTFINLGAKIVLIRPWEGGVFPQNEIPEGWTLADTNEVIRKIALRFNIPYIDSSSINSEAAKYHYWPDLQGSNSLHYNDLGYAYFADAFIKEIGNMNGNFVKLLIPV